MDYITLAKTGVISQKVPYKNLNIFRHKTENFTLGSK